MLPHLVDVHSVRVVSTTGVPERELRDIYGIIQLEDYDGRFDLYKEKRENPTKSFLPDGTLPLTGPSRYFDGTEFYVTLKLRERHDDGPDLDFGTAHHAQIVNHVLMYEDKPVRSVFRGKDGYSVIHFTAVSNGIQATVEVSLSLISNANNQRSHLFVYGSLVTRCRKYSYNTEYDRKYFQTTLFNVPEDEPKELEFTGFDDGETKTKIKIPLSRSVVPVPLDDQLIIEADFWVKPGAATATGISEHPAKRVRGTVSEPGAQHVNGIVAFDVQSSEADVVVSKVIMVEHVSVEFKVIFSTPPRI